MSAIDQLYRAIGALEASVKSLTDNWQVNDRKAADGRKLLYEKIDELKAEQSSLKATVEKQAAVIETQTRELAEIKPAIKRFEADRQRREGANSLAKLLWVGLGSFATGLVYLAHELVAYLWPHAK